MLLPTITAQGCATCCRTSQGQAQAPHPLTSQAADRLGERQKHMLLIRYPQPPTACLAKGCTCTPFCSDADRWMSGPWQSTVPEKFHTTSTLTFNRVCLVGDPYDASLSFAVDRVPPKPRHVLH